MRRALVVFVVLYFLNQVSTNVIEDEIIGYNNTNNIFERFGLANVLKRYTDNENSTSTTKCFEQVQLLISQPSWALKSIVDIAALIIFFVCNMINVLSWLLLHHTLFMHFRYAQVPSECVSFYELMNSL